MSLYSIRCQMGSIEVPLKDCTLNPFIDLSQSKQFLQPSKTPTGRAMSLTSLGTGAFTMMGDGDDRNINGAGLADW